MFWVDEIVLDIEKKLSKDSYLVNDSTTPSGHSHVGSLRGIIIHDLIRRGLIEKGKKAKFTFGFDDFDPMDGMPSYIDASWRQYMGKPLCNVPAPDGKSESFAAQYINELKKIINYLGVKAEHYYTSRLYKEGKFNEPMKIVLDNADKIRKIYKEVSGSDKGKDWYPINVVCPKCGKIGTTKVTGWDGKEVEFSCEEKLVEWAKGCGYKGKISPFDGNAKMPYKVEWPSKWYSMGIDIEGAGKDHAAAGGTRDVANRIYREVFDKIPPYDAPYEHILINGAKMSSSKGLGVTARQMADILPANILRFLFTRTKYKRAIEFNPEGDTIALLYDEYDRCAETNISDPKSDLARAFYYTNSESEYPKYLLRFSKIAYMLQMPRVDIFSYAEKEKNESLTSIEKKEIENRIEIAKKWLEKFAPESFKFNITENLPEAAKKLSSIQKEFLTKILLSIKEKDYSGEELHHKIHNIKKEMQIDPKEAFSAIYLTFIGKDSGPQAGWLLASLDKEFVIKRLKEVINA